MEKKIKILNGENHQSPMIIVNCEFWLISNNNTNKI